MFNSYRYSKLSHRLTGAFLLELQEEMAGLTRKAQRDAAVNSAAAAAASAAARTAANAAVAAVVPEVSAAIDARALEAKKQIGAVEKGVGDMEARIKQLEAAVAESTASARASSREAGSVAGMLARDVAAARTDTREGLETLAAELRVGLSRHSRVS